MYPIITRPLCIPRPANLISFSSSVDEADADLLKLIDLDGVIVNDVVRVLVGVGVGLPIHSEPHYGISENGACNANSYGSESMYLTHQGVIFTESSDLL